MEQVREKANCYKCEHRREVPGNCHIRCANIVANVEGHEQGKRGGWFHWPFNFDPTWLMSCDGFSEES